MQRIASFCLCLILCFAAACEPQRESAASRAAGYTGPVVAGGIRNPSIGEASGLARSNHRDDVLWTMNDEGPAVLYALGADGSDHGALGISNATNVDWEDLAAFELDGKPYLLIADTGDNEGRRAVSSVYVIEEPDLPLVGREAETAWEIRFKFPDGPQDCEAVAVDVPGRRVLLLSKRRLPPALYALPLRPDEAGIIDARRLRGIVSLPQPGKHDLERAPALGNWHWQPTAMDIAADGRTAAILTYQGVYLYSRFPGDGWPDAFGQPPVFLDLAGQRDAEGVTISSDNATIFVALEGHNAPLLRFDRQ